MPTVRAIAKHVNLSPATVSRALRGVDGVSPETIAKVQGAAEELGYGGRRRGRSRKTIALLITTQVDGGLFELARRHVLLLNEEFSRRGWQLHPVMIPENPVEGEKVLSEFIAKAGTHGVVMDGCIMIGRLPAELLPRYHRLLAERFTGSIVMLCRHDIYNGLGGVAILDYDAGIEAANVLIEKGHRKFGWIGSLGSETNAAERLGGVYTALRKAGCRLSHEMWMNDRDPLPASEVSRMFKAELPKKRADWPTAWICSTDWLAAKLIVWARGEGLSVPGDLSVVAFDNTQVAEELAECVITSMTYDSEQIARMAVELLELQFDSTDGRPMVCALPLSVRRGKTVAAPSAKKKRARSSR